MVCASLGVPILAKALIPKEEEFDHDSAPRRGERVELSNRREDTR